MEIRWLDHTNKIIGLSDVTDEEDKLLHFLEYVHCGTIKDENRRDIEVYKPISLIYLDKIGKWVAFKQEGMTQTLHGKVNKVIGRCFRIKCKNGGVRYVNMKNCYRFFDNKAECYKFKL